MADINTTITGIEHCLGFDGSCNGCPFRLSGYSTMDCRRPLMQSAYAKAKEYRELLKAILELGYPHNFQNERTDIEQYMRKATRIVNMAVRLNSNGSEDSSNDA